MCVWIDGEGIDCCVDRIRGNGSFYAQRYDTEEGQGQKLLHPRDEGVKWWRPGDEPEDEPEDEPPIHPAPAPAGARKRARSAAAPAPAPAAAASAPTDATERTACARRTSTPAPAAAAAPATSSGTSRAKRARNEAPAAATTPAPAAAARAPAAAPSAARAAGSTGAKRRKIVPMSHLDFLEKIAEGFVVEAYNSTKTRDGDKLGLDSYNLDRLEQALREMRGEAPPSSKAMGSQAGASKGGSAAKRKFEVPRPPLCAPSPVPHHPLRRRRPAAVRPKSRRTAGSQRVSSAARRSTA